MIIVNQNILVEKLVKKYIDKGMPIVVLNPGVITGLKTLKHLAKQLLELQIKNKAKFCPESYIPLVHIDDVIKITLKLLKYHQAKNI